MHIVEANNITTERRGTLFPKSHLHVRFQLNTGWVSMSVIIPTLGMECASDLRSCSSLCGRLSHCFRLVSFTKAKPSDFRLPKMK